MLFTNVLTYALAFASTTPIVAALYHWDSKLQLYTLGEVPAPQRLTIHASAKWMGQCNGGDIPEGGYGCGTFIKDSTVIVSYTTSPLPFLSSSLLLFPFRKSPSANLFFFHLLLVKCVKYKDGSYWLAMSEICVWEGKRGGQCVKNQLKKGGKKFYPERSGEDAVCVQPEVVGGQPWKPEHPSSTKIVWPGRTRAVR